MKNTFGTSVALTLFGESHGEMIGAVLDGLAPGIAVEEAAIEAALQKRRPQGAVSTARREQDPFRIVSGVFNGKTTGTPLCILIPNENKKSRDYEATRFLARPGHADYTANEKYHGFQDYRGGGHFSGRITAALVAAGAILQSALKEKGIRIGSHVKALHGILDREFSDIEADLDRLAPMPFPVLNAAAAEKMQQAILDAKAECDSLGGILECIVTGVPAGVGEPWFDSVESLLSHALFSVGGVKGIEFGTGFDMANRKGSEVNDAFRMENGKVITATNRNGGINGGITNGMPILFRLAVKPTPSIAKQQQTVDFSAMENADIAIGGRHDPCIVHRAAAVAEAVTALVIADLLAQRFGTDWLKGA